MSSRLPYTAIDTELFPADYSSGRQRWLVQLGSEMRWFSYPCPGTGPEGEALFTDTAWIGPEDAVKVLVVIGGTHGIEGFAGSCHRNRYSASHC